MTVKNFKIFKQVRPSTSSDAAVTNDLKLLDPLDERSDKSLTEAFLLGEPSKTYFFKAPKARCGHYYTAYFETMTWQRHNHHEKGFLRLASGSEELQEERGANLSFSAETPCLAQTPTTPTVFCEVTSSEPDPCTGVQGSKVKWTIKNSFLQLESSATTAKASRAQSSPPGKLCAKEVDAVIESTREMFAEQKYNEDLNAKLCELSTLQYFSDAQGSGRWGDEPDLAPNQMVFS